MLNKKSKTNSYLDMIKFIMQIMIVNMLIAAFLTSIVSATCAVYDIDFLQYTRPYDKCWPNNHSLAQRKCIIKQSVRFKPWTKQSSANMYVSTLTRK